MRTRDNATLLLLTLVIGVSGPASAQIKPAASGEPSFREPEMRRHGSGFVRPNRPQHAMRRAHRHFP